MLPASNRRSTKRYKVKARTDQARARHIHEKIMESQLDNLS